MAAASTRQIDDGPTVRVSYSMDTDKTEGDGGWEPVREANGPRMDPEPDSLAA